MLLLQEYYESGNAPHEALGRAARKLSQGGALYLGGGVGIERQAKPTGDIFRVAQGTAPAKEFPGPLSAVIHAFTVAGSSTMPDTPGGTSTVSDPAAAARLRELADEESEAKRDIERYAARAARRAKTIAARPWSPSASGIASDDAWELRRVDELKADLSRIVAERSKLLKAGKVEEVEQARPGTNFTKIPPKNVAKLKGIIEHYKGMAHPFTACVRDQIKHGLSQDHANRRCAVVKDLAMGTTKWRKGGKKLAEECERVLSEAVARIEVVEEMLGSGMSVALVEGLGLSVPGVRMAALVEGMSADYGLLALAGHPIAQEAFTSGSAPAHGTSAVADAQRATGQKPTGKAPAKKGQQASGGGAYDDEKHPRGKKGTSSGGKFVSKSGGSSTEVRTVQHRLGASPDGKFGPKTEAAVRAFQKKHGLVVDGVVGRQTLAALSGKDGRNVKPGALTGADRRELRRIRSSQTRRRAQGSAPTRSGGGRVVGGAITSAGSKKGGGRNDDDPNFNWRTDGNGKRGVVMADGSRRVVSGAEFDRLKKAGKLSSKTPKLKGD